MAVWDHPLVTVKAFHDIMQMKDILARIRIFLYFNFNLGKDLNYESNPTVGKIGPIFSPRISICSKPHIHTFIKAKLNLFKVDFFN